MNDDHQFPRQGFAAYDRPNKTLPKKKGMIEKMFGPKIASKTRSPLFATGALLLTGAAFAAIVVMSYPGSDTAENVPIIKAETTAFKEAPKSTGGMDVPFQDSTIFMSMQGGELKETTPVEDLIADEAPVDRFAMFEEEAVKDTAASADDGKPTVYYLDGDNNSTSEEAAERIVENLIEDKAAAQARAKAKAQELAAAAPPPAEKPFEIKKIEQTIEKIPPKDLMANAQTQEKPKTIYAPGASPDTLAFVRSVLDQKNSDGASIVASDASAAALANIAPAAGAAGGAGAIEPGIYFVQLGSVTSEPGAHSEWGKFEKRYTGLLNNVSYRVKRANLDKGTYYRIQAGPMSKDSANAMCDQIKAQKPGGCLVVR